MAADPAENQFGISWHDSAWIPNLNPENVLEYFSQRTNPFYDRTCNNEIVKMQRLDLSQLQMMQGLEYILLHVQDPILFIIRKQHRHSPTQVTALADYYILAGVVYQSPDLGSLINSRMLSALHNLTSAFDEASSYARYHPSKGYWWEFKDATDKKDPKDIKKDKSKSAPSSMFQRQHIDLLLEELIKKYPPQRAKLPTSSADAAENKNTTAEIGKKPEETPSAQTLQGEDGQGQQPGKRPLPTESTEKIPPAKKRK